MIIISNYRLEERGGNIFRKNKRECQMPDMQGNTDSAWRA